MRRVFPSARLLLLLSLFLALGLPGCGDEAPPTPTADGGAAPGAVSGAVAPGAPDRQIPAPAASEAGAPGAGAAAAPAPAPTEVAATGQSERWYEVSRGGAKAGYFQVVWSPSTWQGKSTLHDTTTRVTRSVRDMLGHRDVFESTTTVDLERGEDGTLWWQRYRVEEADRVMVEELTWNGAGYDHVARIQGEVDRKKTIATDTPVMTDSEAFLGLLARDKKLAVGQAYRLPQLDVVGERVRFADLTVVAEETIQDEAGHEIPTFKIRESDAEAKTESLMWLDADGAFVKIKSEGGQSIQRVTARAARNMPAQPITMRITTPSTPPLERVFSADRMLVDVHLRGDVDRKLPEFPDSPWSRPLSVSGNDKQGWVIHCECRKYDSQEQTAQIPVTDEAFRDDLKPTVLMQSEHPRVRGVAKRVVGDETDARKAAYKLARYVTESLRKQSPPVGQASALQILDLHCGDCSEHCLLFVTLCRAAGIPARRCSGYVNIGANWGAHAWCEIWTGQWIAADPTTGEVGGGARYLFFGYSDKAGSYPGVVSARIQNRIRFVSTRIEEGAAAYDLTDMDTWRRKDAENGRYLHVLAGLEAREVPSDWNVQLSGSGRMTLSSGDMRAQLSAGADQGMTFESLRRRANAGLVPTTFGGADAIVQRQGMTRYYLVFSRRRTIRLTVTGGDPDSLAMLEKVLRPTFADKPPAWDAK